MEFSKKEQKIIFALLFFLIFLGGLVIYQYSRSTEQITTLETSEEEKVLATKPIIVHVSGAVNKPGVYKLEAGKRVIDAIEMAGGANSEGDLDKLNLAAPLEDGQKISLPFFQENISKQGSGNQGAGNLLNLNSADEKALESLPGIGPALAKRIVDYRNQQGPFNRIEDLRKVSGIGEKKFAGLKDLISTD